MTTRPLGLHQDLVRSIRELGFEEPTPIQLSAIPTALEGRDVLACAATGSGKTAAFLLPTIQRLMGGKLGRKPRALVITPTRELAAQVADDLADLAVHTKIEGAAIYGGVSMKAQIDAFEDGFDVLVATPGRLLDHLTKPYASLDDIEILILDEADRMLDMGFLPDIKRILRQVPTRRQTLFFSATMPTKIARLADEILNDPVKIAVERRAEPAAGVRQKVVPVAQTDKPYLLLEILKDKEVRSVLCFTRTKHRANRLTKMLDKNGIIAERIHGNRSQSQRQKALEAFRHGRIRVLVATDIAARGIDIDDLSHVINFDVPNVAEDYIHRVGRTARAQRTGDAITFVSKDEEADFRDIEHALKKKVEREPRYVAPAGTPRPQPERSSGSRNSRSRPRTDRSKRSARPASRSRRPRSTRQTS